MSGSGYEGGYRPKQRQSDGDTWVRGTPRITTRRGAKAEFNQYRDILKNLAALYGGDYLTINRTATRNKLNTIVGEWMMRHVFANFKKMRANTSLTKRLKANQQAKLTNRAMEMGLSSSTPLVESGSLASSIELAADHDGIEVFTTHKHMQYNLHDYVTKKPTMIASKEAISLMRREKRREEKSGRRHEFPSIRSSGILIPIGTKHYKRDPFEISQGLWSGIIRSVYQQWFSGVRMNQIKLPPPHNPPQGKAW